MEEKLNPKRYKFCINIFIFIICVILIMVMGWWVHEKDHGNIEIQINDYYYTSKFTDLDNYLDPSLENSTFLVVNITISNHQVLRSHYVIQKCFLLDCENSIDGNLIFPIEDIYPEFSDGYNIKPGDTGSMSLLFEVSKNSTIYLLEYNYPGAETYTYFNP